MTQDAQTRDRTRTQVPRSRAVPRSLRAEGEDVLTAVTAGWGLLIIAILLAVIASMTKKGSLPCNGAVGIRTSATKHCDACWSARHRAAIPLMRWTALVAVVVAVAGVLLVALLPLHGDALESVAGAVDGVGYLVVVGLLLWAARVAHRAARRVHP